MDNILGKIRFQIKLLFTHVMQKIRRISRFLRRCLKRVLIQGLLCVLTASQAEVLKRFVKKTLGITSVLMPDFLSDGMEVKGEYPGTDRVYHSIKNAIELSKPGQS
ncbi:MAG: hypothetical protein KBD83_01180 [Gammaproteobacteria bacterium]|nr:hypothetical protein [Gammaproteobacteria bacterium]